MINSWLDTQQHLGRSVYLMLDSDGQRDARNALMATLDYRDYVGLYAQTAAAALVDHGPYLMPLDPQHPTAHALFKAADQHWGWLASSEFTITELVEHWRQRLIVGQRPQQALYRFHDNRVLAKALAALPKGEYPVYLGPMASVCYWTTEGWAAVDNPAPGPHPPPDDPAWLSLPPAESVQAAVLHDNAYQYLLAEQVDAFATLAAVCNPGDWLKEQLALAQTWGWTAPERIALVLEASLIAKDNTPPRHWQPKEFESQDDHFDRVQYAWRNVRKEAQS
ncbi:hypothetical protein PMM47T1_08356 [Pseudomonas sp. M47T1]|uniref:DUF4123 domain-containing protein n=1 Tax=Pseudomonas sp. M47T1 TaxID=1179778 RepID=UPI0002607AEA|nr:DUF4123 domain-containing protein [Pseudomonas sp. M47T1]EIK97139.1 hypothetical protein PMM47T1_08356 [Pseudomonas sp. M47T1]